MASQRRSKSFTTAIDHEPFVPPKRDDSGAACIVIIYGPELGRRAELTQAPFEIGRASKCSLSIDHESVSRTHARISYANGEYAIEDLGSTNGTFVNDALTDRTTLRDGDQLKVGRSILKFMSGNNIETSYHEEIFRLMTVDALTQTFNKRHFSEELDREFSRSQRYERALSLVLFDVDHFKKVNDTYGHLAGDRVLQKLCAAIKPRLRQQDFLARVGGEEFAIILPEVGLEGARITAEKARGIAEQTSVTHENATIKLTISLGVAMLDAAAMKNALELYKLADTNLYAAKQGGRNRVC